MSPNSTAFVWIHIGALGAVESGCKLWEIGGDNVGTKRLREVAIGDLKIKTGELGKSGKKGETGELGESGEQRWQEMVQLSGCRSPEKTLSQMNLAPLCY